MNDNVILKKIKFEVETLGFRNTPALRGISKRYYKNIMIKPSEDIFALCSILLDTKIWSYQLIAYDWAFRLKNHYDLNTYELFENWLYTYIKDWYDCDDFCCHAFGHLLYKFPELATKVYNWTKSDNFAVRRSAAVVFIYSIRRGQFNNIVWKIIENLLNDEHYLVLKGYGWLLKEMTKNFKSDTINFLQKYEDKMPRISFRYSIEKLNYDEKRKNFNL